MYKFKNKCLIEIIHIYMKCHYSSQIIIIGKHLKSHFTDMLEEWEEQSGNSAIL